MAKVKRRIMKLGLMLKVSKYGSGYYMRIPTDIAETLMLKPGDRVSFEIREILPKGVETLAEEE
jgi:antitoxin component of MazEF toxin-antitoxin module